MSIVDQNVIVGIIIGYGLHAWVIPYFRTLTPTLRGEGEEHPILKQCDELHDLGFNAGWCGAIEECAKHLESIGARYHGGRDLTAHLRTLRGERVQAGAVSADDGAKS